MIIACYILSIRLFVQLSMHCPARPKAVDKEHFVKVGFSEGIHLVDLWHSTKFFLYMARNRAKLDFAHFYSTVLVLMGPILASVTGLPSVITITGLGRTFTSRQMKYRSLRLVSIGY